MSDKVRVRFSEDRTVKDHHGKIVDTFKAGKVYALSYASANRWIIRGVAEPVDGEEASAADDVTPAAPSARKSQSDGPGAAKTDGEKTPPPAKNA